MENGQPGRWVENQGVGVLEATKKENLQEEGGQPGQTLLRVRGDENQDIGEGGLPWWCSGYESAWQCRGHGFDP